MSGATTSSRPAWSRSASTAPAVLAVVLAAVACSGPGEAGSTGPTAAVVSGDVVVWGLGAPGTGVEGGGVGDPDVERSVPAFAVTVDADGAPALPGRISRAPDGAARFEPRFPLEPGMRYRVVVDAAAAPLVVNAPRPVPSSPPPTGRVRILPSGGVLAENTLRFYVDFGRPMRQGDACARVQLVREGGGEVALPFLDLEQELWDPSGTRLTLLCDPGRVKRGLRPRQEDGPILVEGSTYMLRLDPAWPDADGRPLVPEGAAESVEKRFGVGPPDETGPAPTSWSLDVPAAGTSDPLRIGFAEPVDEGMAERLVRIEADGRPLPGRFDAGGRGLGLVFVPAAAWRAGVDHRVVVDARLEDPCGNSVRAPFEVDTFGVPTRASPTADEVFLPFKPVQGR